jgi:hypothetical protein
MWAWGWGLGSVCGFGFVGLVLGLDVVWILVWRLGGLVLGWVIGSDFGLVVLDVSLDMSLWVGSGFLGLDLGLWVWFWVDGFGLVDPVSG